MFTDEVATPARVETLIDLLRTEPSRRWDPDVIARLLQPPPLPAVDARRLQAARMLTAAEELCLIETSESKKVRLVAQSNGLSTRDLVREALDERVLGAL